MKTVSPANYFKLADRIRKLKEYSELNLPPESFIDNLRYICTGVNLKGGSFDNDTLYRSRPNEPDGLYVHVDQLKYPDKRYVVHKGRLNREGESILYAALDIVATFIESDDPINRLFTISTIKKTSTATIPFIPLGILEGQHAHLPRNKAERIVIDYLQSEIRKYVPPSGDRQAYNSTIAMSDLFLKTLVASRDFTNLVLVYPSAKGIKSGSTTTLNVAMRPELFDLHYEIVGASVFCISNHPDRYILNEVNKGKVNREGSVTWMFDNLEMRKRIAKGLLVDNTVNYEIEASLNK